MKKNNSINSRLRKTLCIAAAASASIAVSNVNAFIQPNQCLTPTTITTTTTTNTNTNTAANNSNANSLFSENNEITSMCLSATSKTPQHEHRHETELELDHVMPNVGNEIGNSNADGSGSNRMMSLSEEQREFELMLGKALDTLRSDYPDVLTKDPDFTIYDPQIEVVDPKGITLHSLQSYKTSFQFLHMIIKLFYCTEDSSITFRLVYDCARKNIRISWNAVLIPRSLYGGSRNRLHVDGISVYEFDGKTGLINQHRVEHLLINDAPVEAPQGIFSAIKAQAIGGSDAVGIPTLGIHNQNDNTIHHSGNIVTEFKSTHFWDMLKSTTTSKTVSSLFSSTTDASASDGDMKHPLFNQEEFDAKNASRKKFGVPPLTPDEFIKVQAEVKAMEVKQAIKQEADMVKRELAKPKESKGNFLGNLFGNILQDTCESNYDCERPEVCCDLGFKKMCCSSGSKVFDGPQTLQKIPLRVIADDGQNYPRGGPDGMDDDYYGY